MGQDSSQIREEIEQTRAEMGDTVGALAHKTDVRSRVKESFADKRERLRAQMRGTTSQLSDAAPEGQQIKEGAQQAVGVAEENPIGLALGGVATGFLIGMMLPSTRVEDERVGPIADEVKEKAMETGQEAIERGKDVAGKATEQAVETAKEAGREQAEEMKSSGQETATETGEGMRERAEPVAHAALAQTGFGPAYEDFLTFHLSAQQLDSRRGYMQGFLRSAQS